VYLTRSLAASSGSVVIVDTVGTTSAGGKGMAEAIATAGGAAMVGGEVKRLGDVPRPNIFLRLLRNPFDLDSLAICGAPCLAISMGKETSLEVGHPRGFSDRIAPHNKHKSTSNRLAVVPCSQCVKLTKIAHIL